MQEGEQEAEQEAEQEGEVDRRGGQGELPLGGEEGEEGGDNTGEY